LLPAFAIAVAMAVSISQGSVMRYFGPKESKQITLSVASVSGTLLAVFLARYYRSLVVSINAVRA
jgi:uncharacterized membrane protein SpoIIM required for sporulation